MNSPNQPSIASRLLGAGKVLCLALLFAVASTSIGFACQGGGGGDGGGGGGGGGAGGAGGGGGHGGGTRAAPPSGLPDGFIPVNIAGWVLLGGQVDFMGVRIPTDFPTGDCTSREEQQIGNIPEIRQAFGPMLTDEERAAEIQKITDWFSNTPEGQAFIQNVRGSVPNVAGVGGVEPVREVLSQAGLTRIAQQIQATNEISRERNDIVDALRGELNSGAPNPATVQSLVDRLNESNVALVVHQVRVQETLTGARATAEQVAEAQRRANVAAGALTVGVLVNLASGGAGSLAEAAATRAGLGTLGQAAANISTDLVVGGAINFGQAHLTEGPGAPGDTLSPGSKSVITNTASGIAVKVAQRVLGPTAAAVLDAPVPGSVASAVTQTAMDEAWSRAEQHMQDK